MRTRWAIPIIVAVLAMNCEAETIFLKNGRKIVADSVRQDGEKVFYDIGDASYAIPKSAVDHIADFGSASTTAPRTAARDFVPQTATLAFHGTSVNVIKNDRVDDAAVAHEEQSGDPDAAASANFQAGRFSLEHGERDAAASYFDRALRFKPDDVSVLTNYAAILIRMGKPQDALPLAERAVRVAPDSADAWAALGFAEFQSDKATDAVGAFEKSIKLRPDAAVSEFLRRARSESATEADYAAAESSHFSLRFEGHSASSGLPRAILSELDADYDTLVGELGVAPHANIVVILYTDEAFFDVTHAPSWSTAINDGKLRIPIRGITQMTGELARVLRHELTHSFITELAKGRCPLWLNEGVAQLMESRPLGNAGPLLAHAFAAHREIPLSALESSFLGLDSNSAAIAYAESLAAAQYINDTYGMSDIRRLLQRIGEGASTESALRATFNTGYGQFQEDIATYLAATFGK